MYFTAHLAKLVDCFGNNSVIQRVGNYHEGEVAFYSSAVTNAERQLVKCLKHSEMYILL
jgi:hypothetical protein